MKSNKTFQSLLEALIYLNKNGISTIDGLIPVIGVANTVQVYTITKILLRKKYIKKNVSGILEKGKDLREIMLSDLIRASFKDGIKPDTLTSFILSHIEDITLDEYVNFLKRDEIDMVKETIPLDTLKAMQKLYPNLLNNDIIEQIESEMQ